MPLVKEKKKELSFKGVLAAAKKLSAAEKQLLKIKLFGNDALLELKAFEKEMRKKKPVIKRSDDEIVAAIRKIRAER